MTKTHGETFFFEYSKFRWVIEPCDGQVVSRRLEVLANSDDVAIDRLGDRA